jgi:hypothetical protein
MAAGTSARHLGLLTPLKNCRKLLQLIAKQPIVESPASIDKSRG